MPAAYGVVPEDIAAEIENLFPDGFSATTVPRRLQVETWIARADDSVRLHVRRVASGTPSVADQAARVARSHIINHVLGRVMRAVYAGHDPLAVANAARAYEDAAKADLAELADMGEQAIGTDDEPGTPHVATSITGEMPDRELLLDDDDLEGFGFGGRF